MSPLTPTSPFETNIPTPSSTAHGSNLSTGAIAGIAVGSVIGGILLFALGVVAFLRYRKKTKQKESLLSQQETSASPKESVPLSPYELPNNAVQELEDTAVNPPGC